MGAPLVLIADNDPAVAALLAEVLARSGLRVRTVHDGEAARAEARAPGVAVLVCDLDMPRLSGTEVVESLADLAAPPHVVVVSGYLDAAIRQRLAALPYVRSVLAKPFDLLAFAGHVRELVQEAPGAPAAPCAGGPEH